MAFSPWYLAARLCLTAEGAGGRRDLETAADAPVFRTT
jgi:hypothetical protein